MKSHALAVFTLTAISFLAVAHSFTAAAQVADSTLNFLPQVVVTGSKDAVDVRQVPFTVDIITNASLNSTHRSNILQTVSEQVSGLFVTSRAMMGYGVSSGAAGEISMRGLSGSNGRLMVLIDGHPQYNGIYGHPIADAYQTMTAERVEVLRGPASMLYGSNAMGGVINIVTRGMRQDGMITQIDLSGGSYGTFKAEASNMLRKGRFSSNISGQYGRSDNHRPNMLFEQYGGHGRLAYEISYHWKAYAHLDVTHFNAAYPGSTLKPMLEAFQWITRGNASVGIENNYGKTNGGISVYSNLGKHRINDGYLADGGIPQTRLFRSTDALSGVSLYQNVALFEGNRITGGVDFQNIYGHAYYTSIQTGEVLETPGKQSGEANMTEIAAYVDVRQEICPWLTADAGIRVDHHSVSGTEWVPQLGLVIRPMDNAQIKAMAGKGFRNPTMREMYLYPSSTEDLMPERIMNYELSWKHTPSQKINYGVNLYYLKGDNLIQTINRVNVNTGVVENHGTELEATWTVNEHLKLTTSHSFLQMKYPVVAAPSYSGNLGTAYQRGRLSARILLKQVCGLYASVGDAPVKNDFTLLGASLDYRLNDLISFWIRGDNLLNSSYEINLGFPMPGVNFMGGLSITMRKAD